MTSTTPLPRPTADVEPSATTEIVVGVDSTYGAGEALCWAARLAGATGWGLTAVHAWQPGLAGFAAGFQRAARRRRGDLARWCRSAAAGGAKLVLRDGLPDEELAAASGRTAGAGRRTLLVVGHTAHIAGLEHDRDHQCDRIARHTATPLAIVPSPGGGGRGLGRVVLGLDGSVAAQSAAVWLADVAADIGADVFAVTTCEPIVEWVLRSNPHGTWNTVRRQLEGPWTEPLRRRGVAYAADVVEGINVAHALTQYARDRHADAIVVGLSSETRKRRHPGSDLVERCYLPVVLVPPEHADAE